MRRSQLLFQADMRPTNPFASFLQDIQIPGDDLATIDGALQARFFQKGPDGRPLERWELKEVEVSCPLGRTKNHLGACGFFHQTFPNDIQYKRASWPGALVTRATVRLQDLIQAWRAGVRWNETIVFGGKRPLQFQKESIVQCCQALGIDTTGDKRLDPIQSSWTGINPQVELDMMRFLWSAASIVDILPPELFALPTIFVNAPMKPPFKEGGPPERPTTEDTIQEWLKTSPESGSLLLSSGAPYGMAQDEAFWLLLEPHGFTVETFGHAAPDLPIETFMREVAGCVNRIKKARLGS